MALSGSLTIANYKSMLLELSSNICNPGVHLNWPKPPILQTSRRSQLFHLIWQQEHNKTSHLHPVAWNERVQQPVRGHHLPSLFRTINHGGAFTQMSRAMHHGNSQRQMTLQDPLGRNPKRLSIKIWFRHHLPTSGSTQHCWMAVFREQESTSMIRHFMSVDLSSETSILWYLSSPNSESRWMERKLHPPISPKAHFPLVHLLDTYWRPVVATSKSDFRRVSIGPVMGVPKTLSFKQMKWTSMADSWLNGTEIHYVTDNQTKSLRRTAAVGCWISYTPVQMTSHPMQTWWLLSKVQTHRF